MPKVDAAYEAGRRQHIVQAAGRCFRRSGYEGTSIDDVCREAGMSKGGLYTYFQSKEQLFARVCHDEWGQGFESLAALVAQQPSVEAKLDALADGAFDHLAGGPEPARQTASMSLAVWNEALRDDEVRGLVTDGYLRWRGQLESLIAEGQRDGEIDSAFEASSLANVLIALFDGLQVLGAVRDEPFDVGPLRDTAMRLVKTGILAR